MVKPNALPPTLSSGPNPAKPSAIEEKATEPEDTNAGGSDVERDKADDKSDVKSGRPVKRKFSYEEE